MRISVGRQPKTYRSLTYSCPENYSAALNLLGGCLSDCVVLVNQIHDIEYIGLHAILVNTIYAC